MQQFKKIMTPNLNSYEGLRMMILSDTYIELMQQANGCASCLRFFVTDRSVRHYEEGATVL